MEARAAHRPSPELPDGFGLVETRDPVLLDAVFRLRVRAWRARDPAFPDMEAWSDPLDATARHWVILNREEEPVAAARMSTHAALAETPDADLFGPALRGLDGAVASFNRLVVAKELRGRQLVPPLDAVRIVAAREAGCRFAVIATRAGKTRMETALSAGFELAGRGGAYREGPLASAEGRDAILLLRL